MAVYNILDTTSGAPALTKTNGDLITLLDYGLVTIAGFAKLFSGTNKAIYQMPSGSQRLLRVVHDSAVSGATYRATVRACEAATDVDTVTNPYPDSTQCSDAEACWYAGHSSVGTATPYHLIVCDGADDTPPHVTLTIYTGTNSCTTLQWADGAPCNGADGYANYLSVGVASTPGGASGVCNASGSINSISTNSTCQVFFNRNRDGTVVSSRGVFSTGLNTMRMGGYTRGADFPHPDTGGLHHRVPVMSDLASTSTTAGSKAIIERCYAPCLRNVLHGANVYSSGGLTYGTVFQDSNHNPGAEFVFYPQGSALNGLALETTDTFVVPSNG